MNPGISDSRVCAFYHSPLSPALLAHKILVKAVDFQVSLLDVLVQWVWHKALESLFLSRSLGESSGQTNLGDPGSLMLGNKNKRFSISNLPVYVQPKETKPSQSTLPSL